MTLAKYSLALALLVMMSGCSGRDAAPAPPPPRPVLVVFAASSLREAFTRMGEAFERRHPGQVITFNFAGSQELRTQIEHGARPDILATADVRHMRELERAGRVVAPETFARNEPVLVVSTEAAARIRALADLPSARRIVIGGPDVPIGRYTLQILDNASRSLGADFRRRVEAHVVSREPNVRQVLAKVTLGEADAAIVYRTDAATAGQRVSVVTIPPEINVVAEYPIAVVARAPNRALARDWVDLTMSLLGQQILRRAGFLAVSPSAAPSP